jgi:short subunit dehydrogenase-like uncharacterized protein
MTDRPTAIYGATGYTGKLVAAELARRGASMVLSGRSPEKLEAAARAARDAGGDVVRIAPAPIDDPAALIAAFDGAATVINAAGPFVFTGAPVLRAAIVAGAHYVDTTGEQPWIRATFERFGADLERAGVAAVAGMGFDYVPGDLLCHLVGRAAEPLRELVVAYDVQGFDPTRGTMRSSLEMLKGGDVVYEDGDWVPAPAGVRRASVVFPAPIGRRTMGSYPCGEQITVPRHVRTRRVVSLISTRALAPPQAEQTLPYLVPGLAAALRVDPLRERISAKIGELPEGPPEDARRAVRWTIVCFARGEDGGEARGLVSGPDIYGLTAVTVVHGALLLAAGGVAGAHAPASAFDAEAFLAELAPFGVRWERA